jgi:hypothetical protein
MSGCLPENYKLHEHNLVSQLSPVAANKGTGDGSSRPLNGSPRYFTLDQNGLKLNRDRRHDRDYHVVWRFV